jgi:hypothetical protein
MRRRLHLRNSTMSNAAPILGLRRGLFIPMITAISTRRHVDLAEHLRVVTAAIIAVALMT